MQQHSGFFLRRVGLSLLLTCAAGAAVGVLSGCEQVAGPSASSPSGGANAAPAAPAVAAPSQENTSPVANDGGATVYAYKLGSGQPGADANGLVAVPIKMSVGQVDAARTALESLCRGADSPLPEGTKILSVVIDPATKLASVNFSHELKTNFKGGETEEAQIINSVLKTLGQFNTIDKVQFLVDGKALDTLGGAQDLSQPLPTPQASGSAGGDAFGGNGAKQ